MPEALIPWMAPATLLAMMLFGWRVLARIEDRITNNADKAHATIGQNIQRLETIFEKMEAKVDKVAADVSELKVDMAIVKTNVEHLKVTA